MRKLKTMRLRLAGALTAENVAKALPNQGTCLYSAPCIIGTIIPKQRIDALKRRRRPLGGGPDNASIGALVDDGVFSFGSGEELLDAKRLQDAFDNKARDAFLDEVAHLRRKYGVAAE